MNKYPYFNGSQKALQSSIWDDSNERSEEDILLQNHIAALWNVAKGYPERVFSGKGGPWGNSVGLERPKVRIVDTNQKFGNG